MSKTSRKSGKLFLIGGAAKTCFNLFFELAGGNSAKILVIPHASENWKENGDWLAEELRTMGARRVDVAIPTEPFAIPRGTTAVYIMGGDQSVLVKLLGVRGKRALQRFYKRGGLIAGSSAGAAGQSRLMITGGMGDSKLVDGSLETGRGLALVPDIVVDTHFMERNRYNRLMAAQFLFDEGVVAVGLDEDTGIIIAGDRATVHGAGCANFYVPHKVFKRKHDENDGASRLSVGNVVVSFLSEGCAFDLNRRAPAAQ